MKTTNLTQKELTQLKRANTIELKALREVLQDILSADHCQRSNPITKRYYLGDPLWFRKNEVERDIETCEFRAQKYQRIQNELNQTTQES